MKKTKKIMLLFVCALSLIPALSFATSIVDAGTSLGDNSSGTHLWSGQWLAMKFITTNEYSITDIYGWISLSELGTSGTISIYADHPSSIHDRPDVELYSAPFIGNGQTAEWLGVSGVSWFIPAGEYWVSFEVRAGQTLDAAMPHPFSNPLSIEAYSLTQGTTWSHFNQTIGYGVRISANPVPIPTALWLFGSGLLGLVGVARKKAANIRKC